MTRPSLDVETHMGRKETFQSAMIPCEEPGPQLYARHPAQGHMLSARLLFSE